MPYDEVMDKFDKGKLHSGSSDGPKVKKHDQAVAIMLSEKEKAMKGNKDYQPKHGAAPHDADPSGPGESGGMGARMARIAKGKK